MDSSLPEADELQWFLPEDSRIHLSHMFESMEEIVNLDVFTQEGMNDSYNEVMVRFMEDVALLGSLIHVNFHSLGSQAAQQYNVTRSPSVLIQPRDYKIRYVGVPLGEEARVFVNTIMAVSTKEHSLFKASENMLKDLKSPREVKVFVSPTCPYCPAQAEQAFMAAIACPEFVSVQCIDIVEHQDMAEEYNIQSVPFIVTNEVFRQQGMLPEERFIMELVALDTQKNLLALEKNKNESRVQSPEKEQGSKKTHEDSEQLIYDTIVAGGGPSGLTAAIYAERSGLKTLVLEKGIVGGQINLTPSVENYPGFKKVGGAQLVEMISEQAREYCTINEGEEITELKIGKYIEVVTPKKHYLGKSLILSTGAHPKMLGVDGEEEFFGKGVSVCASCDGWAYKNKKVMMIGGGNTALTEALHLHNMDVEVEIVHRGESFRAEKPLQQGVATAGIKVYWKTAVKEFIGDSSGLTAVRLQNLSTGEETTIDAYGVFLAIGWNPNAELAREIGIKLDQWGYIEVDQHMRTNIPRVYACGDVVGGVQQIATAVGEGSTAALSVFEDMSRKKP